jgi:hypothetical protein
MPIQGQFTVRSSSRKVGLEELSVTSFISVRHISCFSAYYDSQLLTDSLVDVLDRAMVTIAMYTINIGHPGLLLGTFWNKRRDADITA